MTNQHTRNTVILSFMGLALVAMFVWSFVYRTQHPSLVASLERAGDHGGQSASGMDGEAMKSVMAAMSRLQKNPDDLDAMMEAAEAFMAANMWDKSVTLLERALAKTPDDPDVLNHMGVALFNADRPADAAKQFERMLALDATNYRAQFNLGAVTKYGLNDVKKAEELFKLVVANPKADPQTLAQAKQELAGGN